ncbi:uncharacterized protein H6S33_007043 [Morchella sextelata]|uniref:uncharacterized protein n=1 Tax=Morchella sextelata TaxID=1174677 RepID=UPI001D05B5E2|nr:uncharacterized protein H6S33_007043 [Morchella sextelata]KAH0604012.1 hypothetical protein H6S33_007043 [Morchella sextelata]
MIYNSEKRGRTRKSVNDAPPNVAGNNDTVQTPLTTRLSSPIQSRTVSDVSHPLLTWAQLRKSQRVDRQTEEPEDWAEQESEDKSLSSPPFLKLSHPPSPYTKTRGPLHQDSDNRTNKSTTNRNSYYFGLSVSDNRHCIYQVLPIAYSVSEDRHFNGQTRRSLSYTYVRGLERSVLNGTVNDLLDDALFKEPFSAPDRIDQIFENTWLEVCRAYNYRDIPVRKEVLANLKQRHSTSRGMMTQGIERFIYITFGFQGRSAIYIQDRVEYLLQSDRYIWHPTKYDNVSSDERYASSVSFHFRTYGLHGINFARCWRFAAQAIRQFIQSKYYYGERQRDLVDPKFMDKINDVFVALAASVIGFGLRNWAMGEWTSGLEFKRDTCFTMFQRHLHSLKTLPILNQVRLINNLKKPTQTPRQMNSWISKPFKGEMEETQDLEVSEGESDDDEL